MQPRSLEQRVTTLEKEMQRLRELTVRVAALESQILQHRTEMRDEFSAIRSELKAGDDEAKRFSRMFYEDVLSRIALMDAGRHPRG